MSNWTAYRLEDFIPFTAEVYLRLLERMGESFWPLHLLTLALGVAALILALTDRARIACILAAPLWVFVGMAFFIRRYAELNWAGHYVGWAFFIQAGILTVIAITGRGIEKSPPLKNIPTVTGTLVAIFGLIGYPLIAPLTGYTWQQAETFGIHPDPTALATLGLTLIALRGIAMWTTAIIPVLWMIVTVLTLLALDMPWTITLCVVLALGVAGLVWQSVTGRDRHGNNP